MRPIAFFGFLLAVATQTAHALESPRLIDCPPFLAVEPAQKAQTPDGWRLAPRTVRYPLSGGAVYAGPESAAKPVERDDSSKGTPKWRLDASKPAPYLLECQYYGAGAVLLREIPRTARNCVWRDPGRTKTGPFEQNAAAGDGFFCK
ncbi:MAG TPA: STY0301 family protein [Bdellovibrionota bacterium]|jgi:hypothetical protein|nr:STY0301 family protein [Bdellovibrionota bacterium]